MRVAVDGRSLAGAGRGVAGYLTGMLRAVPPEAELLVLLPRGAALPGGAGDHVAGVGHRASSRALYGTAGIVGRPRLERLVGGADVVWLPAPAPVAIGRGVPVALTLHDLCFLERPRQFTRYERLWHRLARPARLARRAARVLAVSQATAAAARARLGLAPDRVVVVPGGPGHPGRPVEPDELAAVRARYGLPERYFLFVGALEPRKAVELLVAGHELAGGPGLVLAGDGRFADRLRGRGVHLVGRVDGGDKAALYAGALAVVLPSWCEGYGYPPLEGYAHGTPAIVSDVPALRETAGDGALYVEPGSVAGLIEAMRAVADDGTLREQLAAGGAEALRTRTWEAAGAALLAALREAASA